MPATATIGAQISTVVVLAVVAEIVVVVAIFVVDKNVCNVVELVDDIVVEVVDPVVGKYSCWLIGGFST